MKACPRTLKRSLFIFPVSFANFLGQSGGKSFFLIELHFCTRDTDLQLLWSLSLLPVITNLLIYFFPNINKLGDLIGFRNSMSP
jgi:hypothetical protein